MSVCEQPERRKKNKHREGTMLVCRGNVVVYILTTVKLRVLTPLLDWTSLFKSCQSSSFLSRCRSFHSYHLHHLYHLYHQGFQDQKLLRKRLCSQSIQMFREEICCVVVRVHSTYRWTFLSSTTVVLPSIVSRCV